MIPLQTAEGTTIHSLQGMTIGTGCDEKDGNGQPLCKVCEDETHQGRCAVKRLAANLGEAKLESSPSFRNAALVAISRARTADDLAFSSPVSRERLAVCGKGAAADKLAIAMERFRKIEALCKAEHDLLEESFEPLLQWAERRACQRNIEVPWKPAPPVVTSRYFPTPSTSPAMATASAAARRPVPLPASTMRTEAAAEFDASRRGLRRRPRGNEL